MKRWCFRWCLSVWVTFIGGGMAMAAAPADVKDTALFQINPVQHKIIAPKQDLAKYLTVNYLSLTTDQPIYWPNEEVFAKAMLPTRPNTKVRLKLQKKDSTSRDLGVFTLDPAGLAVEKILSGKEKKLEPGEYRLELKAEDGTLETFATFTVVEGALGALSFAHEFKQVTEAGELRKAKGAWFLGNAAGAGKRWGNGLNVKNEVRVMNQPYQGRAQIKSRCYLAGCNGVEAGPAQEVTIENGLLEAVLDVSSHSGPFEIEVITPQGSLRYLFGKSGHVERQNIPLGAGFSRRFFATLAPYEGTAPVYGRDIYIFEEKSQKQNEPWEWTTPVADQTEAITLKVREPLRHARLFVLPVKGQAEPREIPVPDELEPGRTLTVKISAPYSLIAIGGFAKKDGAFKEGWGIAYVESDLELKVSLPKSGAPLKPVTISLHTQERGTGKPVSVYGVLEVFDNRVASKSGREPLISAVGDSFRALSDYLSSWRDWTGIQAEEAQDAEMAVMPSQAPAAPMGKRAMFMGAVSKARKAPAQMAATSEPSETAVSPEAAEQELIREGERKVVYCAVVRTDSQGQAEISATLPPQTGRCSVRFTAVRNYDCLDQLESVDVGKKTFIESAILPLLLPGSEIQARAQVNNGESGLVIVKAYGAGLKKPVTFKIKPGLEDVTIPLQGGQPGVLHLEVRGTDNRLLDQREIQLRDLSAYPLTFSDLSLSDGQPMAVPSGRRIELYATPGQALSGLVANIQTTMHSWFGHSEALSARAAIDAVLLRAMAEKLLAEEGLRDALAADLVKTVKDLDEAFYDPATRLFRPYPGVPANPVWSAWVLRNFATARDNLSGSAALSGELGPTLKLLQSRVKELTAELGRQGFSLDERIQQNASGQDVIPVEIDGQVVYRALTDRAVVDWFVKRMVPALDLPGQPSPRELNAKFVQAYDTYRFLRAFERTGSLYYLLLNAKALYAQNDPHFTQVFNQIAKGLISTQDPGLIQGPALLGGVYSAPQTLVRFLELMVQMAADHKLSSSPEIKIKAGHGRTETLTLAGEAKVIEPQDAPVEIQAPAYVALRQDQQREILFSDYQQASGHFFTAAWSNTQWTMGQQGELVVKLNPDQDPTEYYALIALPSVLSLRQTEDLLSDYKGQLLYGQKAAGSEKIQLVAVPFRGSRTLRLFVEASQAGRSPGYVLVRHVSNPALITTLQLESVTVGDTPPPAGTLISR
ncbi:MAG: hypothetical protein AB1439_03185 [candidate division FCPU426 bacterium]